MAKYVLALDVGTTTLRAHIYDKDAQIIGTGVCKVEIMRPKPGYCEMDPDLLWRQVQQVITDCIKDAYTDSSNICAMGITVQRNTFITWDKETAEPFHNFITWQDLRASDYVKQWNKSYTLWLRKRVEENQVYFGCIETWLLWKLTKGKVYATEYSCASTTGLFDPFQLGWSGVVSHVSKVPLNILPPIKDTSGQFGICDPDIFGAAIPITAIIADQQSATFGQCCFNVGDVKCTMGTGTFIDCNTGHKSHASIAGFYPLVGWKYENETVYLAEGNSSDTGQCLEWAKSIGLYEKVEDTSDVVMSVQDSGGVYFVPAFSGLQAPINDDKACTSLVGISPHTSKVHILRAILESLAFRFKLLYDAVHRETKINLSDVIRCDGGVCNNEFLVQLVSDLTGRTMDRPVHMDMTSLGVAFLAGLAVGVWKDKSELLSIRKTEKQFEPRDSPQYKEILTEWKNAMRRSMGWYNDVDI
ncbi:hypothetical protein LSH36_233g02016 [Paralvinella palmiformis]|uniref:Glycerol kinase n=1 Tax=Paralvinella palmiformis TaxID=53620 RepID=A0AAD9JM78_9ANNE|nr:hypothetical protein LSH36_233g02016 [Paralvinella palmiformis]